MRTFEYRLYPTRAQRGLLMACLVASRHLYNEMLDTVKRTYAETRKFPSKYDLTALFKGRGGEHVPATTVQCLADRLDKALKAFLRRRETDPKAGFPRFKSPNRWHSIHLRQHRNDFRLTEPSTLGIAAKLGTRLKMKVHRPLEGIPKTAYLVLRADGHWYALIVCDDGPPPDPTPEARPAVGLDVGLKHLVADSDGHTIAPPQCYRKSQRVLRVKQRTLCRRTRGSHRRRKAARSVAKTHLKIARQRRDFLHKTAKRYADQYGRIIVEDLNICGMVRNHHLAKSIMDASWNAFLTILTHKAERAGGQVIKVPARFTSQRCSGCGEIVPKSLSVRTHICGHCGLIDDRDVNAARNILQAGAPPSGHNAGAGSRDLRSRRLKATELSLREKIGGYLEAVRG